MKTTAWVETDIGMQTGTAEGKTAAIAAKLADYLQLVKFKLTALVVITTALGYLIALRNPWVTVSGHFALTLLGALLVVGAANAFNQVRERDTDAVMTRTKWRPLPAGRMSVAEALLAATGMAAAGLALLAWVTNGLTAMLAAVAMALYVFAYTPLKRKNEFCTLVGAVSGAIPPMMGWTAVRSELSPEAWALFALQFLWQFPHFWAIAWLHRHDYQKVGFHLLPVRGEPHAVARQTVLYTVATVLVSAYPLMAGEVTALYAVGATVLGTWFIHAAWRFYRHRSHRCAKTLLCVADSYLPLVLLLWLWTKG